MTRGSCAFAFEPERFLLSHFRSQLTPQISYDAQAQTTTFGFGLGWDGIYSYLDGFGVSVVGGRVSGVGSGGYRCVSLDP